MKTHSGRLLVAIGSLAVASTLAGQVPRRLVEADSIPLELAAALAATGGFGGEPQILVGSMPEWIANRLVVPAGGHVVGSAFLGTTVVGIVSVGGNPDSALTEVRSQLMQRGWKNPPPTPNYSGGGFRPAPSSSIMLNPTRATLCSDQDLLSISATRRRSGGTDITYRIAPTINYSVCRPPDASPQAYRSPFPTLYNPVEASDLRANGECNGNSGSSGTGTTLRTSMTAEQLLDHYARQIQDSGWTASGDKASIVGRAWTRTDSTGAPVEMTLTVATPARAAGCRELNLQVRTFRKP